MPLCGSSGKSAALQQYDVGAILCRLRLSRAIDPSPPLTKNVRWPEERQPRHDQWQPRQTERERETERKTQTVVLTSVCVCEVTERHHATMPMPQRRRQRLANGNRLLLTPAIAKQRAAITVWPANVTHVHTQDARLFEFYSVSL